MSVPCGMAFRARAAALTFRAASGSRIGTKLATRSRVVPLSVGTMPDPVAGDGTPRDRGGHRSWVQTVASMHAMASRWPHVNDYLSFSPSLRPRAFSTRPSLNLRTSGDAYRSHMATIAETRTCFLQLQRYERTRDGIARSTEFITLTFYLLL